MDKKKGFIVFLVAVVILLGVAYFGVRTDFWGIFAKPGSCLVLPEKYCKTGVDLEDGSALVAFKLPDWTPIFAPFDGEVLDAGVSFLSSRNQQSIFMEYFGDSVPRQKEGGVNFFMAGDYRLKGKIGGMIKKGEKLAIVSKQKEAGGIPHNLLVSFSDFDSSIRVFFPTLETTRRMLGL
jgi:hypothetical protein